MCEVQLWYAVLPAQECQRLCECVHLALDLLCKCIHFIKDAISFSLWENIFRYSVEAVVLILSCTLLSDLH